MRTAEQQARLEQVLKTVLSDDYDATAGQPGSKAQQ